LAAFSGFVPTNALVATETITFVDWPETGLEEINGDLPEEDFWPETIWGSLSSGCDLRGVLPPVLKITQCVLIGLESSLLYMILQGLSRKTLFPETCGSRAFRKGASLEIGSAVHFLLDSSPVM